MIRDKHSKALIETDIIELKKYRNERERDRDLLELKKDVKDLKECINSLVEVIKKIEARA
jgi:hypothetical protein